MRRPGCHTRLPSLPAPRTFAGGRTVSIRAGRPARLTAPSRTRHPVAQTVVRLQGVRSVYLNASLPVKPSLRLRPTSAPATVRVGTCCGSTYAGRRRGRRAGHRGCSLLNPRPDQRDDHRHSASRNCRSDGTATCDPAAPACGSSTALRASGRQRQPPGIAPRRAGKLVHHRVAPTCRTARGRVLAAVAPSRSSRSRPRLRPQTGHTAGRWRTSR